MNFCKHRKWMSFFLSAAAVFTLLCSGTAYAAADPDDPWWEDNPDDDGDWVEASPDDPWWEDEGAKYDSEEALVESGSISVSSINRLAKDYDNVPEEFLEAVEGKESISVKTFEKYVYEYHVPLEFVQRFFDDFVFKNGNELKYIPVDNSLPMNNYNWDNLVHTSDGEIRYVEGGVSKALKGIDVSKYQGTIDWERVKDDGVDFAFIRLGYRGYGTGKLMIDGKFRQNIQAANDAGIKVGVYFFTQAITRQEAINEANLVLETIADYEVDFPVVLDIEDASSANARTSNLTKQKATEIAKAFCETIEAGGYRPMIYTNTKWFTQKLDMHQLTEYDKWLAQYYRVPFFPYAFDIWQYGKGKVDGISGEVDLNLSFVDYN